MPSIRVRQDDVFDFVAAPISSHLRALQAYLQSLVADKHTKSLPLYESVKRRYLSVVK